MIKNLSAIDTNTHEGRFLMAAMAKITTESQTDKTPDEVLVQLSELVNHMYKEASPIEDIVPAERLSFEKQLSTLINQNSRENESNTPDFVLGEYLQDCLIAFNKGVNRRELWYAHRKDEAPVSVDHLNHKS